LHFCWSKLDGANFVYLGWVHLVSGVDGNHILPLDEAKVRGAAEFREAWDMDCALEKLSGRRRASRLGFLNEDVFIE
jgi:hypothetical protein